MTIKKNEKKKYEHLRYDMLTVVLKNEHISEIEPI